MNKIGLVFAGGGGKGAYQIGVWKAIREYKLEDKIYAISGTSVGALNTCLLIHGNYENASYVWQNEVQNKILLIDKKYFKSKLKQSGFSIVKFFRHGFFSKQGVIELIDKYMNLKKISKSPVPIYITCLTLKNNEIEYFQINGLKKEKIKKILCASSALPFIFEPETIDNKEYIDGGFNGIGDNVPIKPIYELNCEIIIVVHLSKQEKIDQNKYPKSKLYQIIPNKPLGGLFGGILDFSSRGARRRIKQGYLEAKIILEPLQKMFEKQNKIYKIRLKISWYKIKILKILQRLRNK